MSQAVRNKSRRSVLCPKQKVLSTVFQQARGLMFRRKITETAYIFPLRRPRRIDLHMFFVFFPIDVLFLDEDKNILEMKEGFLPFTFYVSKNKISYVIELPAGTIERTETRIGDAVGF